MSKMIKRILTLALAVAMLVSYLPGFQLPARAVEPGWLDTFTVEGLGVEATDLLPTGSGTVGTATWTADGKMITNNTTQPRNTKDATTTLTLTNNLGAEAHLMFKWEAKKTQRNATLAMTIYSAEGVAGEPEYLINIGTVFENSGDKDIILQKGEQVVFELFIPGVGTRQSPGSMSMELLDLNLYIDNEVTTTFQAVDAAQGSYTVDGVAITQDTVITRKAAEAYKVEAIPAAGYVFSGWYSATTDTYLSTALSAELKLDQNQVVYPKFIKAEDAVWAVGDARFENLEAATYCAERSQAKVVVLLKDYTLTGSHTIPKDVVVLVPFDDQNTCYTDRPGMIPKLDIDGDGYLNDPAAWVEPYAYRTLTLAAGAEIIIKGGLSVSAQHHGGGQLTAGAPSGPCGFLMTEAGAKITVENGGSLYAWGYVVGSGAVEALSGASVYENLQITDFRGGSASSGFVNTDANLPEEEKEKFVVFPFTQYYVQNIEIALTIHSGAKEVVQVTIYAANEYMTIPVDFIGTDKAMFRMEDGACITKRYDGAADRLVIDVSGNVSLNGMTVVVPGFTGEEGMSSSMFNLPINSNITINVNGGTTTINQNVALLPGAEVNIAKGAKVAIGDEWDLYVYDRTEWMADLFVHSKAHLKTVSWSYANGRKVVRTDASLVDAKIDVNGVLEAFGYLYTTESGANICSSQGTGIVVLWFGAGDKENTYQATQEGTQITHVKVPLVPAQLVNADGSFTSTENANPDYGAAYMFDTATGLWLDTIVVKFDGNGATGGNVGDQELPALDVAVPEDENGNVYNVIELPECNFENPGYSFLSWNTKADGTGDSYLPGDLFVVTENVTLYAIWEVQTFDVYVDGEKFAELDFGANLAGLLAALEEPTKSGHIFAGWVMTDAEGNVYTGTTMPAFDVYITASWTEIKKVTYTYLDKDGNELKSELVEEGSAANYPDVPAIIETTYYTYTFEKWVSEADEAGNVTYTATYTATAKTFHITYMDGDVLFTEDQADDTNNWTVETPAPTKEGYNFLGWATEQNGEAAYQAGEKIALTADLTLYAVWEEEIVYYTVTINGNDIPVKYGDIFTLPASTENRTGYSFAGWYVSGNSDVIYQPGDTYTVTEDVTFEAKWTINQYNLCFYVNGTLIGTLAVDYQTRIDQTYLNYNGPAVNVEGYSLVEWRTDTWGNRSFYMPNYDVKLYASLTVNSYKLTWIIDGVENSSYVEYGSTLTAPTPTKDAEGCIVYTFSGWDKEIPATMPAENLTFTGSFIESTVHTSTEVTYTNNGDGTHSATHDCCGGEYVTNESHTYDETTHACVCGAESHAHDHYVVDGDIHQSVCSCGKLLGEAEHTYVFEENDLTCACVCGVGYNGICTAETGIYWIENGIAVENKGLVRVVENGEAYYYYFEGYTAVTNGVYWVENSNDLLPKWDYTFGADGVIEHDDALNNEEQQNHEISVYDGIKYYTIDGIKVHYGLFEMDGAYYYARRDGSLVCGKTYWITDTNGLMEEGSYTFDAEGRMIMDGIVGGYYYVKGVRTYAGLIKIDGAYYYVRTSGQIATGKYWITKTNGLMPQGSYEFDADGKMLNAPAEMPGVDEAFTGIKDGYYYENGKLTYAGLIELDGKFYYVRTSGQVATGRYWITKTNGLMEAGSYLFGADGAMIVE